MELITTGRVTVPAKIENLSDQYLARQGVIPSDQVRTIEIPDALVDTGATLLSMPKPMIEQLGLEKVRSRRAKAPAGIFEFGIYEAVRLTVQGRDCITEVGELFPDSPVLIGQVPLEVLDWVVDSHGRKLIGNPDHGGEQMIELY